MNGPTTSSAPARWPMRPGGPCCGQHGKFTHDRTHAARSAGHRTQSNGAPSRPNRPTCQSEHNPVTPSASEESKTHDPARENASVTLRHSGGRQNPGPWRRGGPCCGQHGEFTRGRSHAARSAGHRTQSTGAPSRSHPATCHSERSEESKTHDPACENASVTLRHSGARRNPGPHHPCPPFVVSLSNLERPYDKLSARPVAQAARWPMLRAAWGIHPRPTPRCTQRGPPNSKHRCTLTLASRNLSLRAQRGV